MKFYDIKNNENGQSLIEFVLILPILLLLVLGMIEYGWLLNGKITLNSAAREGARVGVVLNVPEEERKEKILDTINDTIDLSGMTIEEDDLQVTEENDDIENIRDIIVEVNCELEPIIGLYLTEPVPMKSVARMRRE
ncbi:MAG: TadE-like protein [Anaerocolumna sp.]|jgi:Flp pilus assembly protein TadG|nr:TadE-like protein [Anaerocolumna sp.]